MVPLQRLRRNPHFAPLFAHVHPLCWPILWWSLNRLFKWYDTAGYTELLYTANQWGFVRIVYLGDKAPDPSAYRPVAPDHPRWDDPFWETGRPACLMSLIAAPVRPAQMRLSGEMLRALATGAFALTIPDTS